jgi:hypothetical protein
VIPTTDEMDHITPEERNALVGYCENDERWFKFTRGVHHERCPICKGKFSSQVGYQLTTQRTFKEEKLKKRRRK